ncbi:hypothetical protein [Brevibacillus borstelensis]
MYERNGYIPFYERDLGHDDKLVFLQKQLIRRTAVASKQNSEEVSL